MHARSTRDFVPISLSERNIQEYLVAFSQSERIFSGAFMSEKDYVPNDIKPSNINLKVDSQNIKLSITITDNKMVLITAGKEFAIPAALKPTPLAPRNHPFRPFGGRYVCHATLGDTYLPPFVTVCCS